jgi:apolipoprotein N-acyltransferase
VSTRANLFLRIAVTLFSASLLSLLAPPANWHWMHWFVFLPIFWVLREDTARQNRWYGYLYGVFSVALLFRWIVDTITLFSPIPWIVSVGILLLFAAVFGAPYVLIWSAVHPLRKRIGTWWVVVLPAVAVVTEWLSTYIILFPYHHGASQYRVPYTWQLISVTGIWGLTYLIYLVNCAWAEVLYRRREGREGFPVYAVAGSLAALSAVVIFGAVRYDKIERSLRTAPVVRMGQVQLATTMVERMEKNAIEAFDEWVDLTKRFKPGQVDIMVWSEGSCPYYLSDKRNRKPIAQIAKRGQFEFIIGAGARDPVPGSSTKDFHIFNTVYFFDENGGMTGRYDKMVPLPFGEYLPGSRWFPRLAGLIPGVGNFRPGTVPTVVEGRHMRVATPICYEAILGRVCRQYESPDVLVNVTNDGWFGDTAAPHQHAMLAAIRATELGVPMFRAAYSGVSLIVEPHGHIYAETEPFTEVARITELRAATVPTVYARFGDWFVWLCMGIVGFATYRSVVFERKKPA